LTQRKVYVESITAGLHSRLTGGERTAIGGLPEKEVHEGQSDNPMGVKYEDDPYRTPMVRRRPAARLRLCIDKVEGTGHARSSDPTIRALIQGGHIPTPPSPPLCSRVRSITCYDEARYARHSLREEPPSCQTIVRHASTTEPHQYCRDHAIAP
jgi:hypothetical protein